MRWPIAILILTLLALAGLLHSSDPHDFRIPEALRRFASEMEGEAVSVDLPAALPALRQRLLGSKFNLLSCEEILEPAANNMFDPRWLARIALTQDEELSRELFELQLLLRLRLREFGAGLAQAPRCAASMRTFFARLRVLSESLSERRAALPEADDDHPVVLQGAEPYLLRNPAIDDLKLEPGDLLLSRGTTFLASAAARLYGDDSNFSHVEMVSADGEGHLWTIGEHLGAGLLAAPMAHYLATPRVRVLVLRAHERDVARAAATQLLQQARRSEGARAELSFDFDSLREAFARANAAWRVPLTNAHGKPKRELLAMLGLKKASTFAPEDLEVDPRFDLVMEWRDPGLTSQSRMRDAVLAAVLDWMDREHYAFKNATPTSITQRLAAHLPNWPIFSPFKPADRLADWEAGASSDLRAFDETSEVLYEHLEDVCEQFKDSAGRWPTPQEMRDELERYRKEDLKVYEEYQKTHGYDPLAHKPDFHLLFRR